MPNYHLGAPCDLGRGSLSLPSSWRPSPELPKVGNSHRIGVISHQPLRSPKPNPDLKIEICQNSTRKKTIPYLFLFYRQSSIPNMTLSPKSMWSVPVPFTKIHLFGLPETPPLIHAKSPLTLSCGNTKMAREISSILG